MDEPERSVTLTIPNEPRTLIGADLGRQTRESLRLDEIDQSAIHALVRIGTPVVTVSFVRGLIEPSVRALGYDEFLRKYEFEATPSVKTIVQSAARLAAAEKTAA
ncbi:MAG: hypothetical protein J0H14_14475 [Alphaproteobacteria bacterium]|nr:hypothetical protein [Alphaproteobacteria bacterium]